MIKIFNDDCFKIIDRLGKVDAIITDIPYEISVENNFKTMKDRTGRNGISFGEWDYAFDCEQLAVLPELLNPNGCIVLFHSFEQYGKVKDIFEASGMECKDRFIWEKTNPMPRNRDRRYISNCELGSWYIIRNNDWTFNRQDVNYQGMVFRYPSESGAMHERLHPTQKNLELMKELIKIHTNENDTILDPFMGSGTVGVACTICKRNFIGVELDKRYFNVARKRLERPVTQEFL